MAADPAADAREPLPACWLNGQGISHTLRLWTSETISILGPDGTRGQRSSEMDPGELPISRRTVPIRQY
jgi:hypothetical protein